MRWRIGGGDVARYHDGVPGFWPHRSRAARSGVRSSLRTGRHGRRSRRDLGLHGFALLPAGCNRAAVREHDGRPLSVFYFARRRRHAHGSRAGGARHALAGHAGSMLGARLRLGTVCGVSDRRELAFRCLPGHVDRGGSRRRGVTRTSSVHRTAERGPKAGSDSPGCGHGFLDRVQHLGGLESLSGHHGTQSQPIFAQGEH